MARLQHHPANSRATATAVMVGRLPRSSSARQRRYRRLAASSARARTAAGWPSRRRASSRLGRHAGRRWCHAASTSKRRAWVFPVLVMDPRLRRWPLESSLGTRPRYAPIERPLKRCHSPISTARPNAVRVLTPRKQPSRSTIDATRADSPPNDRPVKRVTASAYRHHRRYRFLVGQLQRPLLEAVVRQPLLVRLRPRRAVPHQAVTKQQLRQAMTGTHQIATRILPCPHQITRRLLHWRRHPHRHQLTHPQ